MTPVLEVRQLTKSFVVGGERIAALRDVSFSISEAQVVTIAGPSGSGKSTLLNCLARFEEADSGEVRIAGSPMRGLADRAMDEFRNRSLGFVFQHFNLLPVLTAAENVELALVPRRLRRSATHAMVADALGAVGLADRLHHKPAQLSGGEQQRVAIARALVGGPPLVVADEPTASLDGKTAAEIIQVVASLRRQRGTTFLIATHDDRVKALSDRVILLEDGEIVDDTLAEHGLAQHLAHARAI